MAVARIKQSCKSIIIGFGGGGSAPLGQRKDTDKLAKMAIESGDRSLLQLFEQPMPTIEQLNKSILDQQLKAVMPEDKSADSSNTNTSGQETK